jgi:hypothetical protein
MRTCGLVVLLTSVLGGLMLGGVLLLVVFLLTFDADAFTAAVEDGAAYRLGRTVGTIWAMPLHAMSWLLGA